MGLLDANRIQAGQRLILRLDECDLRDIAGEVIEELSDAHPERLVLTGDDSVRGIWSAEELRRAIWNLATNALKYGDARGRVTIAVARGAANARVSVHNLGAPLSRREQSLVFEPFARTDAAASGPSKGWGLGLTLVRGCAEANGGRIQVDSDAARGTTFTIELPLDARPAARA